MPCQLIHTYLASLVKLSVINKFAHCEFNSHISCLLQANSHISHINVIKTPPSPLSLSLSALSSPPSLSPLPPHLLHQVTTEEAQAYADRHDMVAYVELSAKDIKYLHILEDTFFNLARQMVRIREELEMTQSAAFTDEIIRLKSASEEWEILSAPDEPIPEYVYKAQEKRRLQPPKCRC